MQNPKLGVGPTLLLSQHGSVGKCWRTPAPGDAAPEASLHSSASAVILAVILSSQGGWHTLWGVSWTRKSRTGLLDANNEEKSSDTTANPHDRAGQTQPHITAAPVPLPRAGRAAKSQLLQLKLAQNVQHFPPTLGGTANAAKLCSPQQPGAETVP